MTSTRLLFLFWVALAKIEGIFGLATLESLRARLQNLHAEGQDKNSILTSRIEDLSIEVSCTRVAPSMVAGAGRGLFAVKDMHRGELLTCYPGDILFFSPSSEASISIDHKFVWGQHVPGSLRVDDDQVRSTLNEYILQVTDESAILGLPSIDDNMAYAGHFANDGAQPPLSESQVARYVIESNDLANAMHIPLEHCHMVTVATRDIQKGEEILVTYGPEYWRGHSTGWNEYDESDIDISSTSNGKGFG